MTDNSVAVEYFVLYNTSGEPINGELRHTAALNEKPVIIVCHSFTAFKEWGFFPGVAEWFAKAGFVALTFNFSRNGVEGSNGRISDFEKFEKNTFSQEAEDLGIVADAIWSGQIGAGIIDRSGMILLGHSRGGAIAILQASVDERIQAVVSWSAVSSFDRWTERQKNQWRKSGYLPLAKDSTARPLRLGINLLEDIEINKTSLDLLSAASRIRMPWLIIHGKADVTVQYHEAEDLYSASNRSTTELMLLDRVGHLYNASTESENNYRTLNNILDKTLNWLQRKIK